MKRVVYGGFPMDNYRISDAAQTYTHYDMIVKHTKLPAFPNCRAQLLAAFLGNSSNVEKFTELYALVTSLAQLGLDTHDTVTEQRDSNSDRYGRSRQLKVLAGDYFSSQFYLLLSKAGQVEITKQIANAICEVNQLKMNLYLQMKKLKMSAEDYLLQQVLIKSKLYDSFTSYMTGKSRISWSAILLGITRCEVLAEELHHVQSPEHFKERWGFWYIMGNGSSEECKLMQANFDSSKHRALLVKYDLSSSLQQLLEEQYHQVVELASTLDSDWLLSEINHLSEPFLRLFHRPRVLEEI